MTNLNPIHPFRRPALSLVDAVVTLVVLGVVTVPIATGIASLARGSLQNYRDASVRCELTHEAERLRALPFDQLNVGAAVTSINLPAGAADMTVTISLEDYDGDATPDPDFKLVVVDLDGRQIHLNRSNWKE